MVLMPVDQVWILILRMQSYLFAGYFLGSVNSIGSATVI